LAVLNVVSLTRYLAITVLETLIVLKVLVNKITKYTLTRKLVENIDTFDFNLKKSIYSGLIAR